MLKTTTFAAAIALFAGSAFAQAPINADGPLDADRDGFLTEQEFAPIAGAGGVFVAIDSDGDGLISEAEYNEGVRSLADREGDNDLDDRELQRYDELARLFDQEVGDRDNLLRGLFGTDDTQTGAIEQ